VSNKPGQSKRNGSLLRNLVSAPLALSFYVSDRELCQIPEDVKEFAQKHADGRPKRSVANSAKEPPTKDDGADSDASELGPPRQRKVDQSTFFYVLATDSSLP
jgi:hypothetical protein